MFSFSKRKNDIDIKFADIHCHLLPGLDDGSRDMEMTKQMLQEARDDGIETIVFTPHVRRPWLDRNTEDVIRTFESVKEIGRDINPDFNLYLGCELYYSHEILEEKSGLITSINSTDYLLVEFSTSIHFNELLQGIDELINRGYAPIIAHIERYECLVRKPERVVELYKRGIYLQTNADTIANPGDRIIKNFMKFTIEERLIHFVATDAHDPVHRCPNMSDAYRLVMKRSDRKYADAIFANNAKRILNGHVL